ncbi:hypothetical protein [Spirosoma sp. KNUC1025]|uniref:hypothetical protein n=1 Tax=Spirosoma sp. KNUC1025 TaxID=2894082 RepID=UPI0038687228|nr:hypothetical protein LN737_16265 [Spirosoma sp. KNUC1025]
MAPQNLTETKPANHLVAAQPLPPDQISPKSVLLRIFQLKNVARRNWKILLVLVLLGGIIGFVYDMTHKKPPIYNASILFNLGGGSGGGGGLGDLGQLAGAFGFGGGAPDANIFVGDNFLIYATSRPVIEKTLMQHDTINGKDTLLVNYYIRHSGIRDKEWKDNEPMRSFYFQRAKTPAEYTKKEQLAMSDIYSRIVTEVALKQPERKSSFIEIGGFMEDERLTATFIEKHLQTIEQDYQRKQTKKTREMYDLLVKRVDSLSRKMSGTENALAKYMDQNQQMVVAQARIKESTLSRNSSYLTGLYYQALQSADNMRLSLIRETPCLPSSNPFITPSTKK